MSLLDQLSGVFSNLTGGNLSDQEAHQHYDQIANTVPREQLGAAIGPAMSNMEPSDVQQRVANSATQMNADQRGSLVQSLLSGLGGSGGGLGGLGALAGGAGGLGGLLSQLGIDPSVQNNPQNATPEDVGKLAAHAQSNSPDVFHQAMGFYSAHPTLVKALGTAVIAGVARHLSQPS